MASIKGFMFYLSHKENLAELSDSQLGMLLRSLIDFAETEKPQKIADPVVHMAYKFMISQIRQDIKKYEETCQKNSQNGKKGGRPPQKAVGFSESERFFEKPKKANKKENKNENKNKKENEKEKEKENLLVSDCKNAEISNAELAAMLETW